MQEACARMLRGLLGSLRFASLIFRLLGSSFDIEHYGLRGI